MPPKSNPSQNRKYLKNRETFLEKIYDLANGQQAKEIKYPEVCSDLQITRIDMDEIVLYWTQKKFLTAHMGNFVNITIGGIQYVEILKERKKILNKIKQFISISGAITALVVSILTNIGMTWYGSRTEKANIKSEIQYRSDNAVRIAKEVKSTFQGYKGVNRQEKYEELYGLIFKTDLENDFLYNDPALREYSTRSLIFKFDPKEKKGNTKQAKLYLDSLANQYKKHPDCDEGTIDDVVRFKTGLKDAMGR